MLRIEYTQYVPLCCDITLGCWYTLDYPVVASKPVRILVRYQACHVIYQLKISSINLRPATNHKPDSEFGFLIGQSIKSYPLLNMYLVCFKIAEELSWLKSHLTKKEMIICEFSNKNTEFLNIVFRFMNGCWLHTFVENESFVTCWLQRVARLQRLPEEL